MNVGLGHLTELKAHLLNAALRASTEYDAAIAALGRGVAARFERHCNRNFLRVVGETWEGDAECRHVSLPRFPVEEVTAVELRETIKLGWVDQGAIDEVVEQLSAEAGIVNFGTYLGEWPTRLRLTYTGGFWFPTSPPVVIQRGSVVVTEGAGSVVITFDTEFASVPVVTPSVVVPDGEGAITATAYEVTTTGCTVRLSAATAAAGYSVAFVAIAGPGETTDATLLQQASATLAAADASKAITFGTAFDAAPIVVCNIVAPESGDIIASVPTLVTASGFTAVFAAAIPATGYKLAWIAVAESAESAEQTIPAGATALPYDLKYAWLLQCEYIWKLRDKLGLSLAGGSDGGQLLGLTLAGAKLIPDVEDTLRRYVRHVLT